MADLPQRKRLYHTPPPWVPDGSLYFITVCVENRESQPLLNPEIAHKIRDSLAFRHNSGRWQIELCVVMPDHLHALMSVAITYSLQNELSAWKRFTARGSGLCWQRGFFDHRIRDCQSYEEKWRYVLNNPVRAGLVTEPHDWPLTWFSNDFSDQR